LAIGYFGPVSERRWLVNHVNYNKSVTYSTFCYKKKNTKKNTRVVENRKKKTKAYQNAGKGTKRTSGSVHLMKMMTMPQMMMMVVPDFMALACP